MRSFLVVDVLYVCLCVCAFVRAFVFVVCGLVQMSLLCCDIFRTFSSTRRSLSFLSVFAFCRGFSLALLVFVTIYLISSSRGFYGLRGVSILSINSLDFIVDVFSERRLRIRFQIFLQLGHGRRADDARTDEIAVSNETQG